MTRRKKIRRAFLLAASIYIILNAFIFGLMTAYMNTNNTVSSQKLIMANVTDDKDRVTFEILGKRFTLEKDRTAENIAKTAAYIVMPYKVRACAELLEVCFENV